MPTSQSQQKQAVVVSGDHMRGMHHAEVLIMNPDPDGPEGRATTTTRSGWSTTSRTTSSMV